MMRTARFLPKITIIASKASIIITIINSPNKIQTQLYKNFLIFTSLVGYILGE